MSSTVRQRKNVVTEDDSGVKIEDDVTQPDTGWTMFIRIATLVFVVLPIMGVLRVIFLVDAPCDAVVYSLPDPPALEGVLATNDLLVYQGRRAYEGKVRGPESIVFSYGHIYTGTSDGKILHINHAKGEIEEVARLGRKPCGTQESEHICGRPLGMRFDKDGYLIVLDAYLGMFKVNVATGDVHKLFSSSLKVDGRSFGLLNDLDIASDGTIYFTDASPYPRRQFAVGMMEGNGKGRLLRYDPVENTTETVLDNLLFANGVQLSKDGSYVLVTETGRARIHKYHLTGPSQGTSEIFADNLPGFPDNIRRSRGGGYWVSLPMCRYQGRINFIDFLAGYPWLRKQFLKIPTKYITTLVPKCSIILELNKSGQIVRSLQDLNAERFQYPSEVEDQAGVLYIGSFMSPYIGIVDTSKKPPN